MQDEIDVSVVIPTYNRPKELLSCVESIGAQSHLPVDLVVVNDGDIPVSIREKIRSTIPDETRYVLTSSNGPASTSTARNTGVEESRGDVVLLLDDDVEIGPDYISHLIQVYDRFADGQLAGVGGFDDFRRGSRIERLYNAVFYLNSDGWGINEAGIHSWDTSIDEPVESDWLSGNNASYKREVLLDHPFQHWSGGREALEDIATGWELKRAGYHCVIDPGLEVRHHHSEDDENRLTYGIKWGQNRVRMFKQYGRLRYMPLFCWAMFGDVLRNFLAPVVDSRWRDHYVAGVGLAIGLALQTIAVIIDEL